MNRRSGCYTRGCIDFMSRRSIAIVFAGKRLSQCQSVHPSLRNATSRRVIVLAIFRRSMIRLLKNQFAQRERERPSEKTIKEISQRARNRTINRHKCSQLYLPIKRNICDFSLLSFRRTILHARLCNQRCIKYQYR